ncbi:MAG TPA: L-dopachrome tautomerase-related protein, partial [Xenococcaceae cyanobacterium]
MKYSQLKKRFRLVTYLIFGVTLSILLFSPIFSSTVGQTPDIEILAEFSLENPPGNIAITPKGRLIMSQHQFYGAPLRVVEVMDDGSVTAFPNQTWSSQPNSNGVGLHTVLGLRSDKNGVVWMLDRSPGEGQPGKIVAWDTINEQLERVIYIPQPIIKDSSFLNDLAVDLQHNAIYITDTSGGIDSALIVVDLNTGFSRRVLEGDASTRPEAIEMIIDGRTITLGGEPAKIGVNPITIDPDNQWVYYAPMSGTSLYRIRTQDLLDSSLS